MNRIVSILISLILFASNYIAQEKLSLDNCLDILFKQSTQYKMLELENQRDELNYKLQSVFKYPTINLNLGVPFKLNQGVEDVFNSELNQYTLIVNNANNFTPVATLSTMYNLPTGGAFNMSLATLYNTYNSDYSNDRERFQYSFYAGISQPIFSVNNYRVSSEIKEKEFQKTKLNFFNSRNKLIFNTIEKYYVTLLKQKEIALTKRKIEKELKELKEQKLKLKLGKISEIEFITKKLAVKNTELNLSRTNTEFRHARKELFSFLGINTDTLVVLEESVKFLPFNIMLEDALELVVKNNHDYKIFELSLIINKLDYESKTSTRIETELTASAFFSNQLYYLPVDRKIKTYDYNLGINVKVPIMDAGKYNTEAELSEIKLREIKNDIKEKEKELKLLVTEYYYLLEFFRNQYDLQNEKLKIFKDSYKIYKREYNSGRLTLFELQEHDNEIYDAEKSAIETVINYNKNVLQLKTILGMEIF
ncbi:MAG: TolC family protein [Bacteroidetes bacterium]|nr:TolC family protein [Bacteroidota bacterium]MBU1116673.1 TolC family protein [Bacteroidota bacterium]MBU1798757.1 TolC family protein [Bacteroidota bacterium]